MKNKVIVFALLILTACENKPVVIMETELGDIHIELNTQEAPITATNFYEHCKAGTYNGSIFYRVVNDNNQPHNKVKIDVIQGGLFVDSIIDLKPTIPHESTQKTGLRHEDGTISMARNEPGTASTEFFICIVDQPELDYNGKRNPDGQGFAAFGKVTKGMEIVTSIHEMQNTGQYLDQPVLIKHVSIKP